MAFISDTPARPAGLASALRRARIAAASAPLVERLAWLFTALMVLLAIADFSRPIVQADDAFISYRYALNLVRGHGLVFNPGEYVEGFTNLLWTLLIAGLVAIGVHAPAASQLLSVVCAAACLVMIHLYARRFLPERLRFLAAGAPLVLLCANSFACWMTTGLETPLFLMLTLAALLSFDSGRTLATAWICLLAFLCRPEGGIEAAVLLGIPWVDVCLHRPPRPVLLRASLPPLIFAAGVLALTAWRLWYYGDFVPNTFHAKVGQAPVLLGWLYLVKFLWDGAMLLIPGLVLSVIVVPRLRFPTLFAITTTIYTVSIGGDVFAYGRFLLPILPVLVAGAIAAAGWAWARLPRAGMVLALLLPATAADSLYVAAPPPGYAFFSDFRALSATEYPPWSAKRVRAERHFFMSPDEKLVVRTLVAQILRAKPDARLIACVGIGKMGYYNMNFVILDMVGLTDRHVAESTRTEPDTFVIPGHSRTDSDYVLSRKPDIIIFPNITALHKGFTLPAEVDMLTNPKLPKLYWFDDDGGFWVRR